MNQRIERSSFLIPEEKITPFINAILKSKVKHNIDEPGRNHPIAYIVIDDWDLRVDTYTRHIASISGFPEISRGGKDDRVMDFVAQFSNDGFIEMAGDNGLRWRWAFRNGKARVIFPTYTWPEPTKED